MSPFDISMLGNYQVAGYSSGNGLVSTEQAAGTDAEKALEAKDFFRLAANNAYNHGFGKARNARGYMGMLNGRIVKAYTHKGDSDKLEAAQRDGTAEFVAMKESANQLRANILHHARNLGIGQADLARIRTLIGLDDDGNVSANKPLLERKVMAQVVDIVNGCLKQKIIGSGAVGAELKNQLTEADLWKNAAAGKATYGTGDKVTRGTVVYASRLQAHDIVSRLLGATGNDADHFHSLLPEGLLRDRYQTALEVFASQCFDSLKQAGSLTEAGVNAIAPRVEQAVKNFVRTLDKNLVDLALGGDGAAVFGKEQLGQALVTDRDLLARCGENDIFKPHSLNGKAGEGNSVSPTLGDAIKFFRGADPAALRNRMELHLDLWVPLGELMVSKMERFVGQIATGMNKDANSLINGLAQENVANADALVKKLNDYGKADERVAKSAVELGTAGLNSFFTALTKEYAQGLATFKERTKDVTARHADLSQQRANLAQVFGRDEKRFKTDGLEKFAEVYDAFLSNWQNLCQEDDGIGRTWENQLADKSINPSEAFDSIEGTLKLFSEANALLTAAFSEREGEMIGLRDKPIPPTGFRDQTNAKLDQLGLTDELRQQVYDHIVTDTVVEKIKVFEESKKLTFGNLFDDLNANKPLTPELIKSYVDKSVEQQTISQEEVRVYLETFKTLEEQLGALNLRMNYAASVQKLATVLRVKDGALDTVKYLAIDLEKAASAHRESVVALAVHSEGCEAAFEKSLRAMEAANSSLVEEFQKILAGTFSDTMTDAVFKNVGISVANQSDRLVDVPALMGGVKGKLSEVIRGHVANQLTDLNTMLQGQRAEYNVVQWYADFSERLQHIVGAVVESYLQLVQFPGGEKGLSRLKDEGNSYLDQLKCPTEPDNVEGLFKDAKDKDRNTINGFSVQSINEFNDAIKTEFWSDVTESLKAHLDKSAMLNEETLLAKLDLKSARERAYTTFAEVHFAPDTSDIVKYASRFVRAQEDGLVRAIQIARVLAAYDGKADDEDWIRSTAQGYLDDDGVQLKELTADNLTYSQIYNEEDADLFDDPGEDLESNSLGVSFLAEEIDKKDPQSRETKEERFLTLEAKTATPEQRTIALGVLVTAHRRAVAHPQGDDDAHFKKLCDLYLAKNEDIPGNDYEAKYRVIVKQLKGTEERADVIIDREIKKDHVGSIANYKMLKRMLDAEKKGGGVGPVTFAPELQAVGGADRPADAPQTDEEFGQDVRNLFAEMLFSASGNSMDDDLTYSAADEGWRLQGNHMAALLSDGDSVHGQTFLKLAARYAKAVVLNDKAEFEWIDRCFAGWDENLQQVVGLVLDKVIGKVVPELSTSVGSEQWNADFGAKLKSCLQAADWKEIESSIDRALKGMFGSGGSVGSMLDGILAEVFPHNGEQTAADLNSQKIAVTSLKDLGNNEDQNLKFVRSVLAEYLGKAQWIDKRTMMARIVRTSPVSLASIPPVDRRRVAISQFVALVHGAGPVLHKLLQSLSGELFADKELRDMINDVKSGLDPIPRDAVKATLHDLVERTNEKQSAGERLKSIRVESSLGAASVGEAFLCTMTYEGGGEKRCVVKVLRPQAKLKANREADMIAAVAHSFGSGVETTIGMKLDGILAELDLTTEADNINKGVIAYGGNGGVKGVDTVRIEGAATSDALPLAFVEGQSLVKRFTDVESPQIEASENVLAQSKKTGAEAKAGLTGDLTQARHDVFAQVERLRAVHKSLQEFSQLWEQKALKPAEGENGFYHGDLHAGNIMCSVDKGGKVSLTVLDYGNAVDVKSDVAKKISTLLGTLGGVGEAETKADEFLKAYKELLTADGRKNLQDEMDRHSELLKQKVRNLLAKSESGEPVEWLMALLRIMRENFGIEVPTVLDRFIDSKLRLVNAMNETRRMLATAETQFVDILFEEIRHKADLPKDIAEKFLKLHNDDLAKSGTKELLKAKFDLVAEYVGKHDGFEDLRTYFKPAGDVAEDKFAVKVYAQRTTDQGVEAQLQKMQKEAEAEGRNVQGPDAIHPQQVQVHSILGRVTNTVEEAGGPSYEIRRQAGDETATVKWQGRDWQNVSCGSEWPLRVSESVRSRMEEIEKTVQDQLAKLQDGLGVVHKLSDDSVKDLRERFYRNLPDNVLLEKDEEGVKAAIAKAFEKAIFSQVFSGGTNHQYSKEAAEVFGKALSDEALSSGRAFLRNKLMVLKGKNLPVSSYNQGTWVDLCENEYEFLNSESTKTFTLDDTYSFYSVLLSEFLRRGQNLEISLGFLSSLAVAKQAIEGA